MLIRSKTDGQFDPGPHSANYAALEPWYLVGGTLGLSSDPYDGGHNAVLGLWEGGPLRSWEISRNGVRQPEDSCDERSSNELMVTLAAGYRWMAGMHQFYITPKVGYLYNKSGNFCWGL